MDVYTHGEMLPAHYYPLFKKYDNKLPLGDIGIAGIGTVENDIGFCCPDADVLNIFRIDVIGD